MPSPKPEIPWGRALEFPAYMRLKANGAGKPRRFAILAYSGGLLPVDGFSSPVVVDLAGLETPNQIPILIDHTKSVEATLGVTDSISNNGKSLKLGGVVTGVSPLAQTVLAQAVAGHTWQASIGAMVIESEEVAPGRSAEANGQTFVGPVIIARRSVLRETSVLPMGADSTTSVNLAASAAKLLKGSGSMPTFEEFVISLGLDVATLSPEAAAVLQTAYTAKYPPPAPVAPAPAPAAAPAAPAANPTAAAADASVNLQASLAANRQMIAAQFRKSAEIQAKAAGYPLIAAKAIEDDWSIEKVELEVIRASAAKTRPTSFHATENAQPVGSVLEAAMCMTRKTRDHEKQFPPAVLQAAHSQFKRGIGLQQLVVMAAVANGYHAQAGVGLNASNLREVLSFACPDPRQRHLQAAAFSTVSLPGIISNVANKDIETGYMEEDQTWREVAGIKSVGNFLTHTTYRMLDDMEYEEVGPGGNIPHGKVGEESYTRAAKTYARMFSITRQMLINAASDLQPFDDIKNRIGRGSAKKLNRVFWAKWLDNSSFFTAGRGNYITGATTTLLTDMVGLQLALDAFDALRTPAADGSKVPGGQIGGSPTILLTPGGAIASRNEQIYKNSNLGSGTANADANIFSGRYKPVKSVFLNDASITNYSATGWYLLRDPKVAAAVVVSFLDGVETPTVEESDADFNTLGIALRGYHDFGCDQAEYLCGVKSKGAA